MRILASTDDAPSGTSVLDGTVDEALYLGSDRKYGLRLADGQHVVVREQRDGSERVWARGDTVRVAWAADDGVLLADPGGSA
jgi:putative spermidine/putrescine transport system ATP-binding protein